MNYILFVSLNSSNKDNSRSVPVNLTLSIAARAQVEIRGWVSLFIGLSLSHWVENEQSQSNFNKRTQTATVCLFRGTRLFTGPLKLLITKHSVHVKYCIGRRSKCMIKKELIENKINLCFYEVKDNVMPIISLISYFHSAKCFFFLFQDTLSLGNLSHYKINFEWCLLANM